MVHFRAITTMASEGCVARARDERVKPISAHSRKNTIEYIIHYSIKNNNRFLSTPRTKFTVPANDGSSRRKVSKSKAMCLARFNKTTIFLLFCGGCSEVPLDAVPIAIVEVAFLTEESHSAPSSLA